MTLAGAIAPAFWYLAYAKEVVSYIIIKGVSQHLLFAMSIGPFRRILGPATWVIEMTSPAWRPEALLFPCSSTGEAIATEATAINAADVMK